MWPPHDDEPDCIRVSWPNPSSLVGINCASLKQNWHCLQELVDRQSKLSKAVRTRSNSTV